MNTGEYSKTFRGHSDWVRCIKLLNENKMVTCSEDKTIRIWDIATGFSCIQHCKTFK